MQIIKHIPNVVTITRFFIAAFLILDAKNGYLSKYFLPLFFFACFSDFLDGFLARKLKATTTRGCILDGYADLALYLSAFLAAYWIYPEAINKYIWGLAILLLIQLISWGFSLIKFGRMTSYHTHGSKIWGITLFASLAILFTYGSARLFPLMILTGIIANIEEIIITSLMPYWRGGISNFNTAIRLRNEYKKY